jgi:hypothetical protein
MNIYSGFQASCHKIKLSTTANEQNITIYRHIILLDNHESITASIGETVFSLQAYGIPVGSFKV